ncbi:MAG: type II toxin-antitoxin system Phd/YefM family antitoxin [Minisyncoccia bacterium]
MKCISAKDAKNGFGRLLDTARAEPVVIEKHGRAVTVMIAIEEYERLVAQESPDQSSRPTIRSRRK